MKADLQLSTPAVVVVIHAIVICKGYLTKSCEQVKIRNVKMCLAL